MACVVWNNAEKIGNLAQVVLALLALGSLWFAWRQIKAARSAQREATAKAVYADFLKLAFEHQEYDNGPTEQGDKRYEQFAGILLNACDELALGMPPHTHRHAMWGKVISAELKAHSTYLASQRFRDLGGWDLYSSALKSIGLKIIQEDASNPEQ